MSFVTLRTPVRPMIIASAAARSAPELTAPVRVMSPFSAVAWTPTAAVRPRVSASFAVAVSVKSSRWSPDGNATSRWL